jgi:peptide/nickel transport system permease protein
VATLEFVARRLVWAVFVIVGIIIVNFILLRLAPGDPAAIMAGQAGATDEQYIAQLRAQFGLDRPLHVQLYTYIFDVARLDLGFSARQQVPVADLILQRMPATLLLTGVAFLFSLGVGILLGALASRRAGGWADSFITVMALAAYATPIYWLGLMLILLFSVWLGWLPAYGMATIGGGAGGLAYSLDVARHLLMPALTLGLFYMAVYARLTRASMLEVQDQDFVKTAKAKGLPDWRITRAHVLRNAVLPVISYAGFQAGHLVGGAVLVETVFGWPGIGRLAFDALLQRDYNLLLGVFLFTAIMVIVFNIITDIVYTLVDPRIEVGR